MAVPNTLLLSVRDEPREESFQFALGGSTASRKSPLHMVTTSCRFPFRPARDHQAEQQHASRNMGFDIWPAVASIVLRVLTNGYRSWFLALSAATIPDSVHLHLRQELPRQGLHQRELGEEVARYAVFDEADDGKKGGMKKKTKKWW